MTRSIYQFFARVETGEVIPNAEIKVPGHTIYDAATGGSAISQPLIATASGKVAFYIEPGIYNIEVKDPVSLSTSNFADVEIGTARDKLLDNDSIDDIFSPDNIGRSAASTKTVLDDADAGNAGKSNTDPITDIGSVDFSGFGRLNNNTAGAPNTRAAVYFASSRAESSAAMEQGILLIDQVGDAFINFSVNGAYNQWREIYHTANTSVLTFVDNPTGTEGERVNIGGNSDSGTIQCQRAISGSADAIQFFNPNGKVGAINLNGAATNYNTSSDPRLKDFKPSPTDEQINAKFNDLLSSFAVFNWKTDPNGPLVWGFDAHKCIDNGLDMGSEGEGPRDSAIGDVYQEEETNEEGEVVKPELRVSPASIDQSKAVPILLAKIEQLERRLKELE